VFKVNHQPLENCKLMMESEAQGTMLTIYVMKKEKMCDL